MTEAEEIARAIDEIVAKRRSPLVELLEPLKALLDVEAKDHELLREAA